jgi:hypothetical protein
VIHLLSSARSPSTSTDGIVERGRIGGSVARDAIALAAVVDQNGDLGLGTVQDLIRGNADSDPIVFDQQRQMIIIWHEKPLHLTLSRDAN